VSEPVEAATIDPSALPEPRWGLGDAAIGVLLVLLVPTLVVGGVIVAFDVDQDEYDALALWALALLQLPLWFVFGGVPLWATIKKGSGSLVRDFGLRMEWKDAFVGFGAGIVGQFALVLLLPLYDLLGIDERDVGKAAEEMSDRADDPLGVVCLFVVAVIGAAVFEELFYRGLVLRAARRRYGTVVAVIGSSLLFGVMHFQWVDTIALSLIGALFALLAVRYDRLGPSIWAHMAFNLTAFLALLST
jgi:uncharacterized protein